MTRVESFAAVAFAVSVVTICIAYATIKSFDVGPEFMAPGTASVPSNCGQYTIWWRPSTDDGGLGVECTIRSPSGRTVEMKPQRGQVSMNGELAVGDFSATEHGLYVVDAKPLSKNNCPIPVRVRPRLNYGLIAALAIIASICGGAACLAGVWAIRERVRLKGFERER